MKSTLVRLPAYLILFALLFIVGCKDEGPSYTPPPSSISLLDNFYVDIDVNNSAEKTFKVDYFVEGLTANNAVFQFPAVVPGTYDISDVGRFVSNFKVYNKGGGVIASEKISTDQWEISDPESAYLISYDVAETFDAPVSQHEIYPMAGTSISDERVILNTFDVVGYPTGLKERDFYLNIDKPSGWIVGTSLTTIDNYYYADNYDHLVDSPLLMGNLTNASLTNGSTTVGIYSYTPNGYFPASNIATDVQTILNDASAFLKGLPVDHYNFLYLFDPIGGGALEHNYSSMYVLQELEGWPLKNISAHEFFHVVVPLNIHSEIIENFNFAEPVASEHLWLYEGVTEWASRIMQLRNNSVTLDDWISGTRGKINLDSFRDNTYSLVQMSQESYTEKGQSQYNYIYSTGALVATFLDIRLLELSQGTYGLRELILDLIQKYGKENPFPEDTFFDVIVQMTYPEIGDFINQYIKGTGPLPIAAYFDKIGLEYTADNFELVPAANPTPEQSFLFSKWSVNL